jgi:hypothetical protein
MSFIRFNYRYRDYGNYKRYGSALFSNPNNLPLEKIESLIRENLLDGEWFLHFLWDLPDLHFEKTDPENDHPYHEFDGIEKIEDSNESTLPAIDELLEKIKQNKNYPV